jgi:hypothetical protein
MADALSSWTMILKDLAHITARPFLILLIAVPLTQCVAPRSAALPGLQDDSFWSETQPAGSPRVVISLEEQRVGLFKAGQLVGLSPISSGKEGNDTRPGVFKVTEKDEDHRSSWYGAFVDEFGNVVMEDVDVRKDTPPPGTKFMGASMNWFLRFNGAIGMHQGYLPGYPASHGCIRLPEKMAALFYEATPHGATVEVKTNADLISLRPEEARPVSPVVARPDAPREAAATQSASSAPSFTRAALSTDSKLRPITPAVPGAPPSPMTLAPARKPIPKTTTQYLEGFGPQ